MASKFLKNSEGIVRAITSDNLQLEKPLLNENYDIEVHNRNMDKIDNAIQEVKGKVDGLELTAQRVSIADPTNKFEATNVEDALLENKTSILSLKTKVDNGQNAKLTDDNGKHFVISNGDANNCIGVAGSLYMGENITNSPAKAIGTWWTIENYVNQDSWGHQVATAWHSDERYIRRCSGGTWSDWREL